MNLAQFPRRRYTSGQTPIEKLPRFSKAIGATGYVPCAQEIQNQIFDQGTHMDAVVCASGSSGTQAGLVTGMVGCNMNIPVIGIMAGLIDLSSKGYFKKGQNVLFVHTGGATALPVYQDYLLAHQTNTPVHKKGLS